MTYMDAISAIEVITKPMPMAVPRKTKMAPPVPPFVRGMIRVLFMHQLEVRFAVISCHY
jgi:hypothetical protein